MPGRNLYFIAALVGITMLAVAGCGGHDPDATVPPNPTSTPRPTAVPSPTPLVVPSTQTPTPVPLLTPTPTPSPTPTPTPLAPDAAILATFQLAEDLGVGPNSISIANFGEDSWPSSDYGCPAPGVLYAQGEVQGWVITLLASGTLYEFHTNNDGQVLVNCNKNNEAYASAINIVDQTNLRLSTEVEFRRRNAEDAYDLKWTITDQAEIDAVVDTLDVKVLPRPAGSCTPVFRVVFKTPDADYTMGTICGGNTRLVRVDAPFFEGKEADVPPEFNELIGPYFAKDPLPQLPE